MDDTMSLEDAAAGEGFVLRRRMLGCLCLEDKCMEEKRWLCLQL